MSSKTVTVPLGGKDYVVPMLNMDQLERVSDALDGPAKKAGFAVLKIALERADPKVDDFSKIEASRQEIKAAVDGVMELSGFDVPKSPNVEAPATPGLAESSTSSTSTDAS